MALYVRRASANLPPAIPYGMPLRRIDSKRGYDIRTGQELLGHKDVRTMMIYTHVLNRGGRGVKSPAELLGIAP
jgi:integrase